MGERSYSYVPLFAASGHLHTAADFLCELPEYGAYKVG